MKTKKEMVKKIVQALFNRKTYSNMMMKKHIQLMGWKKIDIIPFYKKACILLDVEAGN